MSLLFRLRTATRATAPSCRAMSAATGNRFLERLEKYRAKGEAVICAEGYLFEMERRGYVQIGTLHS